MHRIEVRLKSHLPDARGLGLVKDIYDLGITTVSDVRVADIYWLDASLTTDKLDLICRSLLADPVTHEYWCGQNPREEGKVSANYHAIEVAYTAGVTDPVEGTVIKALQDLGVEGVKGAKTAKRYLLQGQLDANQLEVICNRLLVNPIIQHVVKSEDFGFPENPQYRFGLEHADISDSE